MTFDELSEAIYECRKVAKGEPVQKLVLRKDILQQMEAENDGALTYRAVTDEIRIMDIPVVVAPLSSINEAVIETRSVRSALRDGAWHDTRYGG